MFSNVLNAYRRKCPVCGSAFYPTPEWAYRRGRKLLCSYNCCQAFDLQEEIRVQKEEREAFEILQELVEALLSEETPTPSAVIFEEMKKRGLKVTKNGNIWYSFVRRNNNLLSTPYTIKKTVHGYFRKKKE